MVIGFINAHHKELGIEPICRELAVAPSSWHEHAVRLADASKRSTSARRDDVLRVQIERAHAASFGLYGTRTVWHQLRREGIKVAKCTVERLMRAMGLPLSLTSACGKHAIQFPSDPGAGRRRVGHQRQAFPPEFIDEAQGAEALVACKGTEYVGEKPALVRHQPLGCHHIAQAPITEPPPFAC
jgi:hypothetical protein